MLRFSLFKTCYDHKNFSRLLQQTLNSLITLMKKKKMVPVAKMSYKYHIVMAFTQNLPISKGQVGVAKL